MVLVYNFECKLVCVTKLACVDYFAWNLDYFEPNLLREKMLACAVHFDFQLVMCDNFTCVDHLFTEQDNLSLCDKVGLRGSV